MKEASETDAHVCPGQATCGRWSACSSDGTCTFGGHEIKNHLEKFLSHEEEVPQLTSARLLGQSNVAAGPLHFCPFTLPQTSALLPLTYQTAPMTQRRIIGRQVGASGRQIRDVQVGGEVLNLWK